eukprot:TRINITY_DN4558_c0_g1_i1.p1 TRINITY_DN4558_c0_g1~~TRINITY_DN4558_c0_g1_i1.p1  ORF type:complete len:917 (-),score=118.74 TRINITY_DN4558_c0_g1_i1:79-2694(-)
MPGRRLLAWFAWVPLAALCWHVPKWLEPRQGTNAAASMQVISLTRSDPLPSSRPRLPSPPLDINLMPIIANLSGHTKFRVTNDTVFTNDSDKVMHQVRQFNQVPREASHCSQGVFNMEYPIEYPMYECLSSWNCSFGWCDDEEWSNRVDSLSLLNAYDGYNGTCPEGQLVELHLLVNYTCESSPLATVDDVCSCKSPSPPTINAVLDYYWLDQKYVQARKPYRYPWIAKVGRSKAKESEDFWKGCDAEKRFKRANPYAVADHLCNELANDYWNYNNFSDLNVQRINVNAEVYIGEQKGKSGSEIGRDAADMFKFLENYWCTFDVDYSNSNLASCFLFPALRSLCYKPGCLSTRDLTELLIAAVEQGLSMYYPEFYKRFPYPQHTATNNKPPDSLLQDIKLDIKIMKAMLARVEDVFKTKGVDTEEPWVQDCTVAAMAEAGALVGFLTEEDNGIDCTRQAACQFANFTAQNQVAVGAGVGAGVGVALGLGLGLGLGLPLLGLIAIDGGLELTVPDAEFFRTSLQAKGKLQKALAKVADDDSVLANQIDIEFPPFRRLSWWPFGGGVEEHKVASAAGTNRNTSAKASATACSAHAACFDLNLEGECCPTAAGAQLSCCSEAEADKFGASPAIAVVPYNANKAVAPSSPVATKAMAPSTATAQSPVVAKAVAASSPVATKAMAPSAATAQSPVVAKAVAPSSPVATKAMAPSTATAQSPVVAKAVAPSSTVAKKAVAPSTAAFQSPVVAKAVAPSRLVTATAQSPVVAKAVAPSSVRAQAPVGKKAVAPSTASFHKAVAPAWQPSYHKATSSSANYNVKVKYTVHAKEEVADVVARRLSEMSPEEFRKWLNSGFDNQKVSHVRVLQVTARPQGW